MNITFNTKGYDPFIDFIKAYAILCVLLGHSLLPLGKIGYSLWAGMQVPLFILIQSFHCYKKDELKVNISKIFRRVFVPFLILEAVVFLIALLLDFHECNYLITKFLNAGGYGNGSYYPWIYLQVALLLPVFGKLLKLLNKTWSFILFILICEGMEVLVSCIGMSEVLYRLLAIRYVFLFYMGWLWAKEGIKINAFSVLLSVISLVAIIYFEYFSINNEPWFFKTGWKSHRWPCYFWVAYGLTVILYELYQKLKDNNWIVNIIKTLAICSYEIFLVQMTIRFFFLKSFLDFIPNAKISFLLWIVIFWTTSIYGGILLNRCLLKINDKKIG